MSALLGLLLAASGFLAEVPEPIRAKLTSTNETAGTFVQTKTTPEGKAFVSRGEYRIRPGVDFTWKVLEPFEACFVATPTNYVYSNEDETVSRVLADMPGFSRFESAAKGDFSAFFEAFDARYAERDGMFFVRAKPKAGDLRRVLAQVDAEGTLTNWTLRATFADKTAFSVEFKDCEVRH